MTALLGGHQTITDPDHARSAETLRRAHEDSPPLQLIEVQRAGPGLADYDRRSAWIDGQVA